MRTSAGAVLSEKSVHPLYISFSMLIMRESVSPEKRLLSLVSVTATFLPAPALSRTKTRVHSSALSSGAKHSPPNAHTFLSGTRSPLHSTSTPSSAHTRRTAPVFAT